MNDQHSNFFVIGAEKCGTTSLCEMLDSHPEIYITNPKEPQFFSTEEKYLGDGIQWYESLFANVTEPVRGDGSVTYSYHSRFERVIPRIEKHFPQAKFIYLVRDPISRIQSVWRQGHSIGVIQENKDAADWLTENRCYLERNSFFYERIMPFVEAFGKSRVQILFLDDLLADESATLKAVFQFLNVDSAIKVSRSHANRSRGTRDKNWVVKLRQQKWLRIFSKVIPVSYKRQALDRMRSPIAEISRQQIWNWIDSEGLLADCSQLFEFCQKPQDFWGLKSQVDKLDGTNNMENTNVSSLK